MKNKYNKNDIVKLKSYMGNFLIKSVSPSILYETYIYKCASYNVEFDNYSGFEIFVDEDELVSIKSNKGEKMYKNQFSEMIEKAKQINVTIEQMNLVMNKAGGRGFKIEELENMSAIDLIVTCSLNEIAFKNIGR